jgi:hypothetical protein
MTIKDIFQFTSGSVPGRHHLGHYPNLVGINNQDSMGMRVTDDCAILVVSDGCGSGEHSEVGSRLLVDITLRVFDALLHHPYLVDLSELGWIEAAHFQILDAIRDVSRLVLGAVPLGKRDEFIRTHLLATLLVAVVTDDTTVILSIGDGVFSINGDVTVLDPGADNAPAYIAYGLVPGIEAPRGSFCFTVRAQLPTASVESLLIGTDGVGDLIGKEEFPMPGGAKPVGPLSWFWSPKAFKNSVKVHQRLRLINREVVRERPGGGIEIHRGLLGDDTTLISMRRKG